MEAVAQAMADVKTSKQLGKAMSEDDFIALCRRYFGTSKREYTVSQTSSLSGLTQSCVLLCGVTPGSAYAARLVFSSAAFEAPVAPAASKSTDAAPLVPVRVLFNACAQVLCESEEQHVDVFFDLYDDDGNGKLDPTEVRKGDASR